MIIHPHVHRTVRYLTGGVCTQASSRPLLVKITDFGLTRDKDVQQQVGTVGI